MSDNRIHTLKEINLDAARYRWIRDNVNGLWHWMDGKLYYPSVDQMDDYIDVKLAKDE